MTLVESLPLIDGVVVAVADGSIVYWSRSAEALFGYAVDEALTLDVSALFDQWPPASACATARRKDGTSFLAEVTVDSLDEGTAVITVRDLWGDEALSAIDEIDDVGAFDRDLVEDSSRWSEEVFRIFGLPPATRPPTIDELRERIIEEDRARFAATLDEAIRTRAPLRMQYRIRRGESEVRTLRATAKVIADEDCRPLRIYGSVRDITDAQNADGDRFDMARQLEETRRIATLGRVAATMAHEFNNVMMGIATFVEVLKRRKAPEAIDRSVRGIESGIKRGRTITDEILRYTRASTPVASAIDVAAWLADFAVEAQALTAGAANIHAETGLCVRGDVSQLNQVLVNLLINAKDASAPGAPITIEAKRASDEFADIVVADRGSGIPPDVLDRIFDPLFTTKPRGTGLGLAVVQQVIEAHGGTVNVQSEAGVGTTFHLQLPICEATEPAHSAAGGSLLLVEDDGAVAAGLDALLTSEGVIVRTAASGGEAIREIDRDRPDVIVLDLQLPDISGANVYDLISERWPGLPVIFISGSFDPQEIARHLQQPHAA